MPWQDRLREAAYTSPAGARVVFAYEDVSREIPLRNTEFQFPGVDGSYIQPNGYGGRRYPLRCFFWGDQYDLAAATFEEALLDRGVGRLEHPLYGLIPYVVPTGSITRRDDLKTAANQAVIEVTFVTTFDAVYPSAQGNPRSEIVGALDLFGLASSAQFDESTDLRGTIEKANAKATVRTLLGGVSAVLEGISMATADVRRAFADQVDAVNLGMDVLVGQPVLLAQQIVNLIQAPARAHAGIRSRLESYRALLERILASAAADGSSDTTALPGTGLRIANDFAIADLYAMSTVSGSVVAALSTTFATKPEAISAAVAVHDQLDRVVTWRDGRFGGLRQVDVGGSYQQLQAAVALVTGYLIEVSFTLVAERRLVLDRPRTILDLAAELYGTVDDKLDFLIASNELTGSEILELPAGRTVLYYDAA